MYSHSVEKISAKVPAISVITKSFDSGFSAQAVNHPATIDAFDCCQHVALAALVARLMMIFLCSCYLSVRIFFKSCLTFFNK